MKFMSDFSCEVPRNIVALGYSVGDLVCAVLLALPGRLVMKDVARVLLL